MPRTTHVLLRNRTTKGLWLCPERLVDHYLGNGWMKAAKTAEPDVEQPTAAARNLKEK